MQPPHESETELRVGGEYQYRVRGERHLLNPVTVSKLQHAVRQGKFESYREFADVVDQQNRDLLHAARACSISSLQASPCRSKRSSRPRRS